MMFRNNKNNLYVWRNVAISCLCRYGKFDYDCKYCFSALFAKIFKSQGFINEVVSNVKNAS